MDSTAGANISSDNTTGSSRIVPSKAEGIAFCTAFILLFVFIVVGNLVTVVLFVVNRRLRKRSLFLVVNMACADLMLGTVSLPMYIYSVGLQYGFWTGGRPMSLSIFFTAVDSFLTLASLNSAAFISGERFYAMQWPLKHLTLSMRAYRLVIFMVWTLALLFAAVWTALIPFLSTKDAVYAIMPYVLIVTLMICGCNIGIWRKFQLGEVASKQQNRASQNKRLTKTLLVVSILALVSFLPLIISNHLIYVHHVQIPNKIYLLVNVLNYSNSFVNPLLYALRIPEFRGGLVMCCFRGKAEAFKIDGADDTAKNILNKDQPHRAGVERKVLDTKL